MNKGILIDPANRQVSEVDVADWKAIAPLIDADLFDVVRFGDAIIYVDDEGLYTKSDHFMLEGSNFPLMGKGLVLGSDAKGDTIDCPLTVREVRASITWGQDVPSLHS